MPLKNEQLSDEWVMEQVLHGEIDFFRELIQRYQNLIYSIGMRFFRNSHESEDFVQDVMIKVYQNLKSYQGRAPFRTWLTKIAYNHAIDRVRSMKTEEDISDRAIPEPSPAPEEMHVRSEVREILLKAIEELPEKYKICLDLFFFWGLSYNEISGITGFPVNTIKSHVLRAKQNLRDMLKGTIAERYHEM